MSPHRTQRPWQGQTEVVAKDDRPAYDPGCYLCPGNTRANGSTNPAYEKPFVFQNDFAALLPESSGTSPADELFKSESVSGECRVICYSPRHDLTLAQMATEQICDVVECWKSQYQELASKYEWVQIFENKGAVMGCSNPHPHGQIWAQSSLPTIAMNEARTQAEYYRKTGRPLLTDVATRELSSRERVVVENDDWLAVVPFWAVWPFETLLMPRQPASTMLEVGSAPLADVLKRLLTQYDRLFNASMPYSMGWHNKPSSCDESSGWTVHGHFYPPLLRSALVKKFMVGYEMLAEPQRDLTPELAAQQLRDA